MPTPLGGVAGVAWQILAGLQQMGHSIDCYIAGSPEHLAPMSVKLSRVRYVICDPGWRWDRWYSRNQLAAFVSGLAARSLAQRRLAARLLANHRGEPYDVIYQFSSIEVFGLKRHLRELPPLVLHPETHIAGELRSWRVERRLVRKCEPRYRRALVPTILWVRSLRQRRDIRLATAVVCISSVFRSWLIRDYGLDLKRCYVVPNPLNTDFSNDSHDGRDKEPDYVSSSLVASLCERALNR